MKIIKNGKVYDLGEYDTICDLPYDAVTTAVGGRANISVQLRKDKTSGEFYVCRGKAPYSYNREDVRIEPLTKAQAAEIAEEFLEYAQYVKYFGDPEGELAGAKRRACDAEERAASSTRDKDYWYGEWSKLNDEAKGRLARIAELEGELANLKSVQV